MPRRRNSLSARSARSARKVKRGGCGAQAMVGGEFAPYESSSGVAAGATSLETVSSPQPAAASSMGMAGGYRKNRSRRQSRKMRKGKSMKVFPNNIFRNMF